MNALAHRFILTLSLLGTIHFAISVGVWMLWSWGLVESGNVDMIVPHIESMLIACVFLLCFGASALLAHRRYHGIAIFIVSCASLGAVCWFMLEVVIWQAWQVHVTKENVGSYEIYATWWWMFLVPAR